jgi:hypothetical protein
MNFIKRLAIILKQAVVFVFHADEGANFRNALKDAGFKWLNALVENSIVMGRQEPMET